MGFLGKNSIVDPNSTYNIAPNGGYYYNNELWFSEAYQALSLAARDLLHCLLAELTYDYVGKRKKRKVFKNNGSVSYTEIQFKELRNCCSATYTNARNQLIECGLIKQTHQGGTKRGDRAKYKLLFVSGVHGEELRWKQYPDKNWLSEVPKAKNNQVGLKTRFQKGQSARKSKSTLLKCTHNNANDPIEVAPKK